MKLKIPQYLFILGFVLLATKIDCQNNNDNNRWLVCNSNGIQLGFNYAWYKNSIDNYNLGNTELSLGYSYNNIIFNTINLNISLHGGVKILKSYENRFDSNLTPTYTIDSNENFLYEIFEVDKFYKVLAHNKYFIELPVNFGYTLFDKFEFLIGYSIRYYLPQEYNEEYDFIFDDKFENGISSGLCIKITERLFIHGSYVFTLKNSYSSLIIINGKEYISTLTSRAIHFNLQYNFKY